MTIDWGGMSLDEVVQRGQRADGYYRASLELQGRQTRAQIDAAKSARQSVRWMFWSVAVLALASLGSFALDLLAFLRGPGGG